MDLLDARRWIQFNMLNIQKMVGIPFSVSSANLPLDYFGKKILLKPAAWFDRR